MIRHPHTKRVQATKKPEREAKAAPTRAETDGPRRREGGRFEREGETAARLVSGAASRQLVMPHGWRNPAVRVDTPVSPVLPLEGSWACGEGDEGDEGYEMYVR